MLNTSENTKIKKDIPIIKVSLWALFGIFIGVFRVSSRPFTFSMCFPIFHPVLYVIAGSFWMFYLLPPLINNLSDDLARVKVCTAL